MANIIAELRQETARVRALLPRLDPSRQREAAQCLGFADIHMMMNSLEEMMDSLADLREFADPKK